MLLFESYIRTDWDIKRFNESLFEFLERSAWPLCNLMRQFINEKTKDFESDTEFISKLRSKSDKQHKAAVLELFIYLIFKENNFSIGKIPTSVAKTPDFRLQIAEHENVFIECSLAANALEGEIERKKKGAVTEIIENMENFPFYISINFLQVSDQSISKKELLAHIEKLSQRCNDFIVHVGFDNVIYHYLGQGWDLEFTFSRKDPKSFNRTLGDTRQPAKIVDNFKPIYTALNNKKPGKYNIGNAPYIICMGIDDLSADEEEFFLTLYGPNYINAINLNFKGNGFFIREGNPLNTNVSAVIFCKSLEEFYLADTTINIWHNPFAANPVTHIHFPFSEIKYIPEGNRLIRHVCENNKSVFQLLRIDSDKYLQYLGLQYRIPPDKNNPSVVD